MNLTAAAVAVSGIAAACGGLAGAGLPARWRAVATGLTTAGVGVAGLVAGVAAATGTPWVADIPWLLPLAGAHFSVDALAGWFLLLIGSVVTIVGIYTIGYVGRDGTGPGAPGAAALLPLFAFALLLVPMAGSVSTFLIAWELMAVTSLLLVLTEHRHSPAARSAGVWYAAMTQGGLVAILLGLVWAAGATGGESFAAIRTGAAELPSPVRDGIFLLCLIGAAAKAGAVPLHPWLPRAHTQAPSHMSALMSAAMVKLGIYVIVRVGFDLLGTGPRWWWLLIAGIGALSALYGIVQAAVETDLKRMLAFSTSENVGLIMIGIGAAGLLLDAGQPAIAGVAIAAALLHTLNHAAFKTLLFCGAGAVVRATGTRDLDLLGGLSKRMPITTALIAVGALGAAALPLGNGFISEWLLLQVLLHHTATDGTALAVGAPIAVAVVALTAGIAVLTYVKMIGTGFLARPRSPGAANAREAPATMVIGMGGAAMACIGLATAPAFVAPALNRIADNLHLGGHPLGNNGVTLHVAGIASTISPLWIAAAVIGASIVLAGAVRLLGRPRRRSATWDCGAGPLTARMEYTATSFAEPVQRVFDNVLRPETGVTVSHIAESKYLVSAVQFRRRIPDRVEACLYAPLLRGAETVGQAARSLAAGSIHRYLGYIFIALLVVLTIGAWG